MEKRRSGWTPMRPTESPMPTSISRSRS
ncbi:hypothetical protein LEMLEM_LOCUS26398 [Lemmus lemmus]